MISSGMSSKILKEALVQQKEIQEEEEQRNNSSGALFAAAAEEDSWNIAAEVAEEEEDIDDFQGFDDSRSQFGKDDVSFHFVYALLINIFWQMLNYINKLAWCYSIMFSFIASLWLYYFFYF